MENGAAPTHRCHSDRSGPVVKIGNEAQLMLKNTCAPAHAATGPEKVTAILRLMSDQCQSQAMTKEAVGQRPCAAYGITGSGGLADATLWTSHSMEQFRTFMTCYMQVTWRWKSRH